MFDIAKIYEPATLSAALAIYGQNPQAVVVAGGTDVLVRIKDGKLCGGELLSVKGIAELCTVQLDGDENIVIGSGVTFSHILGDGILKNNVPSLCMAVSDIGGPQIRNSGTIGGNICTGATTADSAACLLSFDAVLQLQTDIETRYVPIVDFYKEPEKVRLRPGELLVAIIIKKEDYCNFFGHSIKYSIREAMDTATLTCSANLRLSDDKNTIEKLRLAYGVAAPTPIRAETAEIVAEGSGCSQEDITRIATAALNYVNPYSSWCAPEEFRLHLIQELAKKAVTRAIELAKRG